VELLAAAQERARAEGLHTAEQREERLAPVRSEAATCTARSPTTLHPHATNQRGAGTATEINGQQEKTHVPARLRLQTREEPEPDTARTETENDEQKKGAGQNSTKSDRNQNETLPNFGQMKFNRLRTRLQEIITWIDLNSWEIQIAALNENGEKLQYTENENHR
jgi:hypothetical protein